MLDEALNIAKYYKRTKGRSIERQVPADLPPLFGVRDQLVQVFLNLVLNAIDATGTGRAHRAGGSSGPVTSIVVTVRDDGAGIAPEHAAARVPALFHDQENTAPAWDCS